MKARDTGLTREQKAFYRRNGYLVVDDLLPAEECDAALKIFEQHGDKDYSGIWMLVYLSRARLPREWRSPCDDRPSRPVGSATVGPLVVQRQRGRLFYSKPVPSSGCLCRVQGVIKPR